MAEPTKNCPSCGAGSQCDAENLCCGEDCPLPDTGDDFEAALRQFDADVAAAESVDWEAEARKLDDADGVTAPRHQSDAPADADGAPKP